MAEPATDTFLARRFNMLGFPGERRGGAVSYAALRAQMGDDNAAALVTRIGEMVVKQGLESLGVPLHHAVDRIVQSLSPDERRTMAEGGTVPRVQALISAELSTAKQQQAPVNRHGSGNALANAGESNGRLPGLMSSRGGNQFGLLKEKGTSGSADASATGLYTALGMEGYTRAQITGAIDYAKSIGISDPSYAGYFVGASRTARDAIAAHIRDGKQLTDDDVEKAEDVTAVVGAIKAKKVKPEEAPKSVQAIMEQMKKDGVDPAAAPPKEIRKWMKDHPTALEAAKKEAKADEKATVGSASLNQAKDKGNAEAQKQIAAAEKINDKPIAQKKLSAPTISSTL